VTAILHPLKIATRIGQETVTCSDLIIEHEILADDMVTVVSIVRIAAHEIIRGLFPPK
jgi:hypothetical protein